MKCKKFHIILLHNKMMFYLMKWYFWKYKRWQITLFHIKMIHNLRIIYWTILGTKNNFTTENNLCIIEQVCNSKSGSFKIRWIRAILISWNCASREKMSLNIFHLKKNLFMINISNYKSLVNVYFVFLLRLEML